MGTVLEKEPRSHLTPAPSSVPTDGLYLMLGLASSSEVSGSLPEDGTHESVGCWTGWSVSTLLGLRPASNRALRRTENEAGQMPSPLSILNAASGQHFMMDREQGGCHGPQTDFTNGETEVPGGDGTWLRLCSQAAEVQARTQLSSGPFRASAERKDRPSTSQVLPRLPPPKSVLPPASSRW